MFKFLRKNVIFTIFVGIVIIFACMYGFDYVRAKTFNIEIVSISPESPVADGETPVNIEVRLTKNNKPVEGHYLYMFPKNGGLMQKNRVETDADGQASFTYYPYRSTILQPARTVTIRVYDEDNSIFVVVNAVTDFEIQLKEKEQ